jgi:hypothetical protein
MRTPSDKPKSIQQEDELTNLSRSSKKVGERFRDYDRDLIKPIESLDITLELKFNLRKKCSIETATKAGELVKAKLHLNNPLNVVSNDEIATHLVYLTDALLEVDSRIVEQMESELDRALATLR